MAANKVWVGLDLGEKRTSVCVVDAGGHPLFDDECETSLDAVMASLAAFPLEMIELIGAEAGTATHLVRKLRAAGFPVAIFEARKASRFLAIRRNKTDASDARGLADLARVGNQTVSQVYLKSVECQRLRSELVLRNRLIVVRIAIEGSIRAQLYLYGRRIERTSAIGGVKRAVDAAIAAVLAEDGLDIRPELEPLTTLCEDLRDYLRALDRRLERRARNHPICSRFMEIPGIGPITALSFYSAIEDPTRFARALDVGPYLGLAPRRSQSGDLSRNLGITKSGNKLTRKHLVAAALTMRLSKKDCALRDWEAALRERIGGNRSKVALARKLAITMLLLWQRDTRFEAYPQATLSTPAS